MSRDTARTRLEPADRRRELLDVAERLARQDGLASLSTQAVATAAGASKALVFHYFGSVVGLQRAVVEEVVTELLAALGAHGDAADPAGARDADADPDDADADADQDRPVVVLDAFITAVTARRELWTDIWRGALHDDAQTQEILDDARSTLVDRLARRSSALRGRPGAQPGGAAPLDPEALALLSRGWVALAENVTAGWLAGSPLDQSELRDLLVRSLSAVLGDTASPPPPHP